MLELVLRLGFSLAAVLGLFWLVAHLGSRRLGGQRSLLKVRARQSLSRTASVAVVEVGDRVLVVGVADGGVRLLTELDPASLAEPATEPVGPATPQVVAGPETRGGRRAARGVQGSVLSAQTWKQAWEAATSRRTTPQEAETLLVPQLPASGSALDG